MVPCRTAIALVDVYPIMPCHAMCVCVCMPCVCVCVCVPCVCVCDIRLLGMRLCRDVCAATPMVLC